MTYSHMKLEQKIMQIEVNRAILISFKQQMIWSLGLELKIYALKIYQILELLNFFI